MQTHREGNCISAPLPSLARSKRTSANKSVSTVMSWAFGWSTSGLLPTSQPTQQILQAGPTNKLWLKITRKVIVVTKSLMHISKAATSLFHKNHAEELILHICYGKRIWKASSGTCMVNNRAYSNYGLRFHGSRREKSINLALKIFLWFKVKLQLCCYCCNIPEMKVIHEFLYWGGRH